MKEKLDIAFSRLKAAAAKAPRSASAGMPYGFDTRVLAAWRNQRQGYDWSFSVFKSAVICATLFLLASLAAHQKLAVADPQNEFAIADSVIRLSMNP
jgi:hypothetical protein